jgi:O-Antigen ligase
MRTFVVLIPFFLSFYIILRFSIRTALMNIYIPTLCLIPTAYRLLIPRFPPIDFHEAVLMPIFFVTLYRRILNWRYTLTDIFFVSYAFFFILSESIQEFDNLKASTYSLIFDIAAPYIVGKLLIVPLKLSIPMAKRFVFLIFLVVFISSYEFLFVTDIFTHVLSPFFHGQGNDWPILTRYGFIRIKGPFFSPILFGIVITTAWFLNHWLSKNQLWEKHFKYFPYMQKKRILSVVLFLGLMATLSRAPIITFFIGFFFINLAYQRSKRRAFLIRLGVAAFAFLLLWINYHSFFDIPVSQEELNPEAASAAYRANLLKVYLDVAYENFWLGWGDVSVPIIHEYPSIDDHYLFIYLQHGILVLASLICIFLSVVIRTFLMGMRSSLAQIDASFALTMFCIYLSFTLTLTTVAIAQEIGPLFFLITGWIEGFLVSKKSALPAPAVPGTYKSREENENS